MKPLPAISPQLHKKVHQRWSKYPTFDCLEDYLGMLQPWILTRDNKREILDVPAPVVVVAPVPLPVHVPVHVQAHVVAVAPVVTPEPIAQSPSVPCPSIPSLETTHRFSPRKPDSLFWSLFVAQYGVNEFFAIGNKYMNREIEEKSRTMEFLKANRALLKSMKMSVATTEELMGDLMTNRQTTLSMVQAFAMYYHCTVWIVSEESRTYLTFAPSSESVSDSVEAEQPKIMYKCQRDKRPSEYLTETNVHDELVDRIRSTYVKMDSGGVGSGKLFKGIGSYKVDELYALAETMNIVLPTVKLKKADVYLAVVKHCEAAWM